MSLNLARIHKFIGLNFVMLFAMFLQVIPLGIPVFPIIIIAVAISYIILQQNTTFYSKDEQTLGILLILALILEIVGLLRGNYSSEISKSTIQTVIYSLLFLLLVGGAQRRSQRSISRVFPLNQLAMTTIISASLMSLVCFYKLYFVLAHGVLPPFIAERLAKGDNIPLGLSLMSDYNMSAVVFVIASFFSIYLYYHYNKRAPWISIACLLLCIYFAFIAVGHGSRRAVLLLITVTILFLLGQFFNRLIRLKFPLSKIQQYAVYTISLLITMFLLSLGESGSIFFDFIVGFSSRAQTLLETDTYDSTSSVRVMYLQQAWSIASNFTALQFVFGAGNGYFTEMGAITGVFEMYPHNFIVSAYLKSGFIGLIHTCVVLLFVLKLARRLAADKHFQGNLFFVIGLCSPLFFSLFSGDTIFSNRLTSVSVVLLCIIQVPSRRFSRMLISKNSCNKYTRKIIDA